MFLHYKNLNWLLLLFLALIAVCILNVSLLITQGVVIAYEKSIPYRSANIRTHSNVHVDIVAVVSNRNLHVKSNAIGASQIVRESFSIWSRFSYNRNTLHYLESGLDAHPLFERSVRLDTAPHVSSLGITIRDAYFQCCIGFMLPLLIVVLLLIWRARRYLTFERLSYAEQDEYLKLVNQIDSKLLEKFVQTLPRRLAIMTIAGFITGGVALPVISILYWMYKIGKNSEAEFYIKKLRNKHFCKHINWMTFPNHHKVIGGKRVDKGDTGLMCPICKKGTLQLFFRDRRREILVCSECSKNIVIQHLETNNRPESITIPGFYTLAIPISGSIVEIIRGIPEAADLDALSILLNFFL